MHYRLIFSLLLILAGVLPSQAQFGISARIQNNTNSTWNNTYQMATDTSQNILDRSYEFGINYWFKLKEYRVEFLPEISMAVAESNTLFSDFHVAGHKRQSYNFNFNVQIYPLDFVGDCDCPTFSKDGNVVSKGFYWLFSPGLSYHTLSTTFQPDAGQTSEDQTVTSFRMGIGAGLDLGFTDLFTLSPFIMYSVNWSNAWESQLNDYLIPIEDGQTNSSNIRQWQLGLRLIFRPDYK